MKDSDNQYRLYFLSKYGILKVMQFLLLLVVYVLYVAVTRSNTLSSPNSFLVSVLCCNFYFTVVLVSLVGLNLFYEMDRRKYFFGVVVLCVTNHILVLCEFLFLSIAADWLTYHKCIYAVSLHAFYCLLGSFELYYESALYDLSRTQAKKSMKKVSKTKSSASLSDSNSSSSAKERNDMETDLTLTEENCDAVLMNPAISEHSSRISDPTFGITECTKTEGLYKDKILHLRKSTLDVGVE